MFFYFFISQVNMSPGLCMVKCVYHIQQTHMYVNISVRLLMHTEEPHSTLGNITGCQTASLMNASISLNVMELVCIAVSLSLQGHNSPGSRMSTYVDGNQNATGSTRPSNRKVQDLFSVIQQLNYSTQSQQNTKYSF